MEQRGFFGSKSIDFPMKESHKLAPVKEKVLDDRGRYRCLVGISFICQLPYQSYAMLFMYCHSLCKSLGKNI